MRAWIEPNWFGDTFAEIQYDDHSISFPFVAPATIEPGSLVVDVENTAGYLTFQRMVESSNHLDRYRENF